MDRYKINLSYYNDVALISSHDVAETILNAEDLELTLARHQTYEGVFLEVSDTFQFIGVDKDYILSVYEDWKTRLSTAFKLEITVNILETSTLIYEEAYKGLCEWGEIGIEENVAELIFTEESNTFTLIQKESVNIDIELPPLTRIMLFNLVPQLNASQPIRYGEGTQSITRDSFFRLTSTPINLSLDNSENEYLNGDTDMVVTSVDLGGSLSTLNDIKIDINCNITLTLDVFTTEQSIATLTIQGLRDLSTGTAIYQPIYLESKSMPIGTKEAEFIVNASTIFSLTVIASRDYEIEIKADVQDLGGTVGFNYELSYLNQSGNDYSFGFLATLLGKNLSIATGGIADVFTKFNTFLGLNIDNSIHTTNLIKDLLFTTSSGMKFLDIVLSENYETFFKAIKKLGFLGLQLTDSGLILSSLNDIYSKDSTIIDLGNATKVTRRLNEEITLGNLLLGSGSGKEDKDDQDYKGYTKSCNYFLESGLKADKDLQITEWNIDSSIVNQRFYDLYNGKLREENDTIAIFSEYSTVDNLPFAPTTPILDGITTATITNAELGAYKRLQTWRNWLITAFDGEEFLNLTSGDLNKDIIIQDNTDNITVALTSDSYSKDSTPFGGLEDKIFGIDKYIINVPITPYLYKTIKANPNNRYKVNYKGLDYIFFLRNISINLLNDSVATIKGWESFNKS